MLPVLVFLFLKYFGKNEFDVPYPHGTSIQSPDGCNFEYHVPYQVPDSIVGKAIPDSNGILVLDFSQKHDQLERMLVENFGADVKIAHGLLANRNDEITIKRCVLLMPDQKDIVVIDANRKIRGYYDSRDRDEIDRLKAEILILLKRY